MENTPYKKDRPQLSENEILKNKDFDATLKNVTPKGNAYLKSIKYWGIGGIATIVIVASIFLFASKTDIQNDSTDANFTYQPTDNLSQLTAIKPPFAEFDIAYEVFEIDCSKDETITTKSGTTFNVPKNSLVDSDGKPITGIAEIHYRELRNPVDFFLSGIPMSYDSAGSSYTFESAGMLDIKAFQNENPLALAENKFIDFKFQSTTPDDGFNFYSLNEETGDWTMEDQCINVSAEAQSNTNTKEPTMASNIVQPIAPVKQNKVKYSLDLAVNKDNYPELEKYQGTIFEINESTKKFDPVIYKIQWEDASLSDSKIAGNYTLKLTREDSSIYLTVYPVVKDKHYKNAISQYHKEAAAYKKSFNHDDFDAYTRASEPTVANSINNDIRTIFYSSNRNRITFSEVASGAVTRLFRIASLGIANADHIMPNLNLPSLLVKTKTVNQHGETIVVKNYNVANSQRNSINAYAYSNTKGIKYHRRGASVVWFVGEDGFISILHPDELKNAKKATELTFNTYPTQQGIDILRGLMAYK